MNPYEPILKEIALGMLQTAEIKPNFSNDAFLDAILIFQTVLTDKIYDCMQEDETEFEDQIKMIETAGKQLKKLIHTYTGLDTFKLVNEYER
jgi:hypothetical protein